jgi:uncharacterized membrane protein (DUF485 family)
MEKRTVWIIVASIFLIVGVIFAFIVVWNLLDEVFWIEVKLFGWDHFYTFAIIMAVGCLAIGAIIGKIFGKGS